MDENLRRDQLRDFFKVYGNWLIAGVVLFLAVSGGPIWWRQTRSALRGPGRRARAGSSRDVRRREDQRGAAEA